MTTKEFLAEICKNAFGDAYQKEIQNMYAKSVAAGNYTEEEKEYTEATDYLRTVFDSNETALLDEYEQACADIATFSAAYGFRAGLLCGFKQYFTNDHDEDGGFSKHVSRRIATMPNMQAYPENYKNIERRNVLYSQLCHKSEAVHTHMVSLDCAWSQRAYSASIYGFYCGYHGAMRIIDEVMPTPISSTMNTRNAVAIKNWFGLSESLFE